MAKRKRLSLKSVQRKRRKKRRSKRSLKSKTRFNAFKVYKDREFPLTPQEIQCCIRQCLTCAKSSVWGASHITIKKPKVLWNTKMRTCHGRAFVRWHGRKRVGELHLNASRAHLCRSKKEILSTLRHEVAHIVQFRVGNKMGHRKDFKLILQKFSTLSDQ